MTAYRLNSSNVVQDTIDGEVLAIRSDNGVYYSMRDTAATIWTALIGDADFDDAVNALAAHHGVPASAVHDEVSAFAVTLVEEQLIVESTGSDGFDVALPPETAGTPWAEPTFEKYTDMQDLLLFDPIHEVQPAGWPATGDPSA